MQNNFTSIGAKELFFANALDIDHATHVPISEFRLYGVRC